MKKIYTYDLGHRGGLVCVEETKALAHVKFYTTSSEYRIAFDNPGDGLIAGGDAVAMSNLTTNRPLVYRIVFNDSWGKQDWRDPHGDILCVVRIDNQAFDAKTGEY
jgi:hypothetical protein